MKSQYLLPYQQHVRDSIGRQRKPLAVGTFICYTLRGAAKAWQGRYLNSLKRGLEKDGWTQGLSRHSGLAYYPPNN